MASLTRQLWDAFVMGAYVIFSVMWFFFVKELGGSAARGLGNVLQMASNAGIGGADSGMALAGRGASKAGQAASNGASRVVASRFRTGK